MIELGILPLLLLVELLLLSSVTAVVLGVMLLLGRRRARAGARALMARVREDAERRDQETRKLLQERFGLEGDELEAFAQRLSREEKRFYQSQITTFLRRDGDAFANLNIDVEALVQPYRELPERQPAAADDEAVAMEPQQQSPDADESAELERLRDENERLSDELRITMETMGRMLNEYSSMFSGGAASALDKEKMLAMFRAEARESLGEETAPREDAGEDEVQAETPQVEDGSEPELLGEASQEEDIAVEPADGGDEDAVSADDPEEWFSEDEAEAVVVPDSEFDGVDEEEKPG